MAWHWPKIEDDKTAQDAALQGVGVGLFFSAVTGVAASLSILYQKPVLGIDGWALFDAGLFALVSWRVYKMSRPWAVFGLLLYLAEVSVRIAKYFGSSGTGSIPPFSIVAIVFTLAFVNAVRGTFAFHRFSKQAARISGVPLPAVKIENQQEDQVLVAVSHESRAHAARIGPTTAKNSGMGGGKKLAVISFCAAAGLAVLLLLAAGGLYLYGNRSRPTKNWPEIIMKSVGIRASLSTELRSGSVRYRFSIEPISTEFSGGFEKEAVSDTFKNFVVLLRDAGQFELCTVEVAALTPVVDDSGKARALIGEGTLASCSTNDYLEAARWDLTYKFSRLQFQPSEAERAEVVRLVNDAQFSNLPPTMQRETLEKATGDPEFSTLSDGETALFMIDMTTPGRERSEGPFFSQINGLLAKYRPFYQLEELTGNQGGGADPAARSVPKKRPESRAFKEEDRLSRFDPAQNVLITDSGAEFSVPTSGFAQKASQWAHSGNSEYHCPLRLSCDDKGDCTIENRWNGQTIPATLLKRPPAND